MAIHLRKFKQNLVAAIAIVIGASAAGAQDTLLTLINSSSGEEVLLDEAGLMALDQTEMLTTNEFVDTMTAFEGPLARDVVALIGAGPGDIIVLTAVNDYSIEVPFSDFLDYRVVFAHSTDGTRLSMRDKGPIWVVYPMSEHEELRDPKYNARLIWQLVKVEVK